MTMSLEELERKLRFRLPKEFRKFIQEYPERYTPDNRNYITDEAKDVLLVFYSIEDLWNGWQNTAQYSYMKDEKTMVIAALLGDSVFTVGVGKTNADVVYRLNWHTGLTPIASSIDQLLLMLVKE